MSLSCSPSSSALMSAVMRSSRGLALRSSIRCTRYCAISPKAASPSSVPSVPARSMRMVHSKSCARSSSGTPSADAMVCSGSSVAMSLTKSHSPRSQTSSISAVTRSRMASSRSATLRTVKTFWTMPRYFVCCGGSMPSIVARTTSFGIGATRSLGQTLSRALEKRSVSLLTSSMSLALVSDQKPSPSPVGFQRTGHSARMRANSSCGGPSTNRSGSSRFTLCRSVWVTGMGRASPSVSRLGQDVRRHARPGRARGPDRRYSRSHARMPPAVP